jgi:hypothetical protein
MSVGCLHRRKHQRVSIPLAWAPRIGRMGTQPRPRFSGMRVLTNDLQTRCGGTLPPLWRSPPLAPSTPATTRSRPLLVDTWFADEDDSQSIWTACECWAIYHLPDLNTARGRTSTTASPRFACLRVQVVLTFPTPGERGNNRLHALFGDSNTAVGHSSDVYRTSRSLPSPTGQVASQPTDIDWRTTK